MKFKDWNWVIGSGFYTDDLKKLIKNKKLELEELHQEQLDTIILISIIFMIIIIILSLLLSYTIQNRFENYKLKVRQNDNRTVENGSNG